MNDENKDNRRRRDKAVMFYLSASEKDALRKLAEYYNLSVSETLRRLVVDKTHQLELEAAKKG